MCARFDIFRTLIFFYVFMSVLKIFVPQELWPVTIFFGVRANFSYVSLENASKRLHARQGNPPCRGTLSTCPGHPSRRAIFCHVNGSSRLAEVRRPRYIPRQLLILTASGDYAQLVECKIIP